jgi:hypothetical protein
MQKAKTITKKAPKDTRPIPKTITTKENQIMMERTYQEKIIQEKKRIDELLKNKNDKTEKKESNIQR